MFSFTLILNSSTILKPIWMGWTVPSGILCPCSVGRVPRSATGRSLLHRSLDVYVAAILQKLRKWENSFAFCNLILPGPAALDRTRKVSPPVWLDWDSVHSVGTMAEVVCDPTWLWIRKEDCNMITNQSTWSSWRSGVLQQPRHRLRHRHLLLLRHLLHPHDGLVGLVLLALHLRVHLAGKRFEQMKSQGSKRK